VGCLVVFYVLFSRDWVKPRKPQSGWATIRRYRCFKNIDQKIVRSQMEEESEDGCLSDLFRTCGGGQSSAQ